MKNYLFALMAVFAIQASAMTDTTRYTVLSSQNISGKMLMWSDGPGKVSYKYEFNDRGRGPKLKVDLTCQDNQVINRQASGVDYYKGAVSESFDLVGGKATWKNKIEEGSLNVSGSVWYMPLNLVPGELEWVLRLGLMKSPHELDLVPLGKCIITHVKNHSALVNGIREELELYEIAGSGPPSYFWVTPKKDFFADIGSWMSTIKLGYEFLIPELKKLQENVEDEYFLGQAFKLTQDPKTSVAITNVNVFDSRSGKVLAGQTVIFDKDKIVQVGKSSSIQVPAGSQVIAGNGKMLLPGLWDNHVHYSREQGLFHLAAGVTNIKDMGNSLDLPELKRKTDKDDLMGPEISIMSGFIDFAGPFAGPTGKIAGTKEEALEAVKYYGEHGYQQIKLYSSIPVDWVMPLAAEAHKRNMKVCGHIPSGMLAQRAINEGYDQIIHLNMIMLNFMGDTIDTRSMGRFTKVAERSGKIDLKSPEVKRFIKLLKEKQIVVDPTVAVFEDMFINKPGKLAAGTEFILKMFPIEDKRNLYQGGLPSVKEHEAQYRLSFDKMLQMIKLLYDNKVMFIPGTDVNNGFTLHRELELYSQAGVPNTEVLRKATLLSAQVAGMESQLGSIEVGKNANMILVDGDPVKNISDIRRIELTIKSGNMYSPRDLYQTYGYGFWK